MSQVIDATFEDGMFKPDETPGLSPHTRVRLLVEPMPQNAEEERRQQAWADIEKLWKQLPLDSQGDRLSREQLHERH